MYSYSKAGNLQSHTTDTSAGPGTPATFGYLGDLMTDANGVSLDWDWNGNMESGLPARSGFDYNWDGKLRYALIKHPAFSNDSTKKVKKKNEAKI